MSPLSRTSVRRALVGLVVAAVTPVLTAAPAHADSLSVVDATGDVWTPNMDQSSDKMYLKVPQVREADFVRTTYTHTDRRVMVTAKFRELDEVGGMLYFATRMRDQDGRKHVVNVIAGRKNRAGRAELTTYGDEAVDCEVTHRIYYGKDKIRVGFPRTCIDSPQRLEFTSAVLRKATGRLLFDNPHHQGPNPRGWTSAVRAG